MHIEKDVFVLKNGLFYENGELIYYKGGFPRHAGVVQVDGDIYYISRRGKAVKGQHIVHGDMANGILKRGTYTFGEDYKLVPGSYIAPSVVRKRKRKLFRKESNQQKTSFWQRILEMDKEKELAFAIVTVVLIVGLVVFASRYKAKVVIPPEESATTAQQKEPEKETPESTEPVKETEAKKETTTGKGNAKISLPQYTEDVLLCSKAAKMEYDGEITIREAITGGNPYRPFVFQYAFRNASGMLWLSEKEDLSGAKQYELPKNQQRIEIHNLKVDTDYYYKVLVEDEEYFGSFHTAQSTRFLYIPGLVNIRDIGGGTTQDGKKVKQGLLIRGSEMDGLTTVSCFIQTEQGREIQQEFGFVYDMDLRSANIYVAEYYSKLGVPQNFYLAPQYGEIFNTHYKTALKNVFRDLANPENYPVYMHCSWGRDRTGTMVFLLQALLNMSEEDMWKEFRRSAYSYSKMAVSEDMQVIIAGLEPYAGDTLQEKIHTYLTTVIGVTQEEIDSIRSILLEDAS